MTPKERIEEAQVGARSATEITAAAGETRILVVKRGSRRLTVRATVTSF